MTVMLDYLSSAADDYISYASATSTLPCWRCGQVFAISIAVSMLLAFTIEKPVRRSDPPFSDTDTPPELTVLGIPKGVPGLTQASPMLPTQLFHCSSYLAPASWLSSF